MVNSIPLWLDWVQKWSVHCMLLCPNLPYTSLNQCSKADNKHNELTVLIYTLCLCPKPCPFLCALILNKDLALLIKIRVRSREAIRKFRGCSEWLFFSLFFEVPGLFVFQIVTLCYDLTRDSIYNNFVIDVYCRCLQILYQFGFFYKL